MPIAKQRRIVAVSSIVVFALGIIHRFANDESLTDPTAARFFIGIGVAFTMVSIATDMGSEIGAGFAMLIMLAAFIYEGTDVFNFLAVRGGLGNKAAAKHANKKVRQAAAKQPGGFRQNVFPNFNTPQFQTPGGGQ